jgi:membrane protease subunit HflC
MNVIRTWLPGILVVLVLLGLDVFFTVDQREHAILVRLSEIKYTDYTPGLHFKLPWIDTVHKFDRRLLNIDSEPERFLTSEKKDVIVDSFVRWRILDSARFFVATRGDEGRAGELIFQKVNAALREEFARRTVKDVVSGERGALMQAVSRVADEKVRELGVTVVDVRVKRIDLPAEVSNSVYMRMRAERERVARDLRSKGAEAAERIRASADRERAVKLAEAYREAETLRGEGDAAAARVYAEAYAADRDFYALYRTLSAYRESFRGERDILLLDAGSPFFRYLDGPEGRR